MYYITVDATSDFPPEFADNNNFYKLPMPFTIGDQHFFHKEMSPIPIEQFHKMMREGAKPVTSCVIPETAKEYWSKTLKEGKDILHIGFSSGLSATFNNLITAAAELREEYPDNKVIVIDSLSAGVGEALLIYYALINRENGMRIEDNAEYLMNTRLNINHFFIVDDLFHLKRGGRISGFKAIVGTAIQLKPLLTVNDTGHLINIEKAISRRMAIKALVNRVKEKYEANNTDMILITEGDCRADADYVFSTLKELYPSVTVLINSTGPILLSHTGMGLLGITLRGNKR